LKQILSKYIFISVLLTFVITPVAQDFDEAYLESLPEGVREQVLENALTKADSEEVSNRRASSMVQKSYCSDDLIDKNKLNCVKSSNRFGAYIFNMMQSSFMPINEPNLDSSYILDFGDALEIQFIGQQKKTSKQVIGRDGSINIPNVGRLIISGLSLTSATDLIKMKVKDTMLGTEVFVSLSNIRDIQVLMSGNTFNPGVYTLNGNTNALHALSVAGGINDIGSYRSVQIIRDNKVIEELDLYQIFAKGRTSYGSRLKSGDSVFVPLHKNIVTLVGGVNKPGVYELKDSETYEDLIDYADGFTYNSKKDSLKIELISQDKIEIKKISSKELGSFSPSTGTTLFVPVYKFGKIEIQGAINMPGSYFITSKDSIASIIERAGGYTSTAYPFGGILENKKALKLNIQAKDLIYRTYLKNLSPAIGGEDNRAGLAIIMDEIKNSPTNGRIQAEFDLGALSNTPSLVTYLEDGDKIIIPEITQQVYIYGEVKNPGSSRYKPGKSAQYYLDAKGGTSDFGDTKQVYIVHPNGDTFSVKTGRLGLLRQSEVDIYPGTVIYVPRKINSIESISVARVWAPLISSLAVTLTSLSVLSKE